MSPDEQTESVNYMFANLGEVDNIISAWEYQGANIRDDGTELQVAAAHIQPSANDVVTADYIDSLSDVFREFALHNDEMFKYATTHIEKLSASRECMAETEDGVKSPFERGL